VPTLVDHRAVLPKALARSALQLGVTCQRSLAQAGRLVMKRFSAVLSIGGTGAVRNSSVVAPSPQGLSPAILFLAKASTMPLHLPRQPLPQLIKCLASSQFLKQADSLFQRQVAELLRGNTA